MFRFVSEYYIILIMTTTVIVWAMQEVETSSLIHYSSRYKNW